MTETIFMLEAPRVEDVDLDDYIATYQIMIEASRMRLIDSIKNENEMLTFSITSEKTRQFLGPDNRISLLLSGTGAL